MLNFSEPTDMTSVSMPSSVGRSWMSTQPTAKSEASVMRIQVNEKSGYMRSMAETRAVLNVSKSAL